MRVGDDGKRGNKTLGEREEEYRLARERIFGREAVAGGAGGSVGLEGGEEGGIGEGEWEKRAAVDPGERPDNSDRNEGRGGNDHPAYQNAPDSRSSSPGQPPTTHLSIGSLVPTQIRRSPAPPGSGGVSRQPLGPRDGGGFAAR